MPAPIVHVGAVMMCPHGGVVTEIPTAPRVLVSGMPIATAADQYPVAGCAFSPGGPHPCVRVGWLITAARLKASLVPVLLQTSVGLCLAADVAPQGAAIVSSTQPRVLGT